MLGAIKINKYDLTRLMLQDHKNFKHLRNLTISKLLLIFLQ